MISLIKEIKAYSNEWNKILPELLKELPTKNRDELLEINAKRQKLGMVGYGAQMFGNLYGIQVPIKASISNSAFVFMCAVVDDIIDKQVTRVNDQIYLLDKYEEFFFTTDKSFNLAPLRDYILDNISDNKKQQLLQAIKKHKDAAVKELQPNFGETTEQNRIDVGRTYGSIVNAFIESNGSREMTKEERKILPTYSAAATLTDDLSDYFKDKQNQQPNVIHSKIQQGMNRTEAVRQTIIDMNQLFSKAGTYLNNNKIKQYKKIVMLTKIVYAASFVKNTYKVIKSGSNTTSTLHTSQIHQETPQF